MAADIRRCSRQWFNASTRLRLSGVRRSHQRRRRGPAKTDAIRQRDTHLWQFSKNFAFYNERSGSLTAVAADAAAINIATSQIKSVIRAIYSSPPTHDGIIVSTILNDPDLRTQLESELKQMCERTQHMRQLLADTLTAKGVPGDHSFITRQRGMFCFSRLKSEHVEQLKNDHTVYIVGNGRIHIAAITPDNCDALCEAIANVS